MTKAEFLAELRAALAGLPEADIEKSLDFYSEMIDDRVEDGLPEEEAVAALGSIEEIKTQILKDIPITKIIKEKVKPKRSLSGLEITLLIVGFPIWLPLLISVAAVIFSVYVTLWSVIVVLYSVDLVFFTGAIAGVLGSIPILFIGNISAVLLLLGGGLVCAGLGILWIFVCVGATKAIVWLTRVFFKSIFIGKGDKK
ncbi:MAG: DUF1700 domain-containing protein [Clostridia bacterium]|nr:DUF1700 domain-containing protein [Clostridia bacterium]